MSRKLKGVRRKRQGWQAYVKVGGITYTKQFPLQTPLQEMKDWRAEQAGKFAGADPTEGSFAADIATYLERVSAMPTYQQRAAHLALWARELGRDRPRRTITDAEIDLVLQAWLNAGVAPATVRKRRTALQSFFGGKRAKENPVRRTARPDEPKPEARAIDYLTIARILSKMPDRLSAKRGTDRGPSLAKIRATVLAYTGLPPGLLGAVRDTDLQLTIARVRIRPRRKGKGIEARTLPLTAEGIAAFKVFHAAGAYGRFAIESVNRAFKHAAQRAGVDPETVHLYDLRHSFLTELYRVTHDLATVARFGLHAEGSKITARYAQGANQDVDAAAAAAFSAALADQRRLSLKAAAPVQAAAKKLPAKAARSR